MGEENRSGARQPVEAAIAALWGRYRGTNLERVAQLERAAALLAAGQLDEEARREAERAAHKLAGAIGTFGFANASDVARELELALGAADPPRRAEALVMVRQIAWLRDELERPVGEPAPEPPREEDAGLLIVESDAGQAELLAVEAWRRGIVCQVATSSVEAITLAARQPPQAAIVDLSRAESAQDGLALLEALSRQSPPVPVLVTTSRDDLIDRVVIAQLGARSCLQLPLAPGQILDAVNQLLARLNTSESKILVVDDDPSILAALQALLAPHGFRVSTLADPLCFWEVLEAATPDLLILDVDMPELSGIELCRVVRTDPRWNSLPVLFLTARNDAETVHRIFAVGADDYVRKPIVGPELYTRIVNRIERSRLLRSLAETDALSGVANRWKSTDTLNQYLRLAERYRQPLALALVDLDHFKQINDRFGHDMGDEVLRRVGDVLRSSFRAEDVVGRWGGEEFVVGMLGMSRADGARRLGSALEEFRCETFLTPDGLAFEVSFSAGIAQYPVDGTDVHGLYRAADTALYRAKSLGRCHVATAVG